MTKPREPGGEETGPAEGAEAGTVFLTTSEVSKMLGVSPNTVARWTREGRLPCQVTLGGHHRFDRAVIDELRQQLHRNATDEDRSRE